MVALRRMRTEMKPGKRRIKTEMSTLFPQRKKLKLGKVWKHRFVCLAYVGQDRIPTTDLDKYELYQAGLGEKEIEFTSLEIPPEDFREHIFNSFPRQREGGGFQLLKCLPNSHNLEVLSMAVHLSVDLLKQRVGKSRTYIRPVQQDLDVTPLNDQPIGVIM